MAVCSFSLNINFGQKKGAACMMWTFIGGIIIVVLANIVVINLVIHIYLPMMLTPREAV
jgi:hypothetical protein